MPMEGENDANMSNEHPLLNSVVLRKIFEYLKPSASLDLDTLKSVRQVCTVWRDESLGWWRKNVILILTPEIMEDPELAMITQFLENTPFHKYKLKDTTINIPHCFEQGTQANRFWNFVGPHVKHLTLEGVYFNCGAFQQKEIQQQTLMRFLANLLPNMSTLIVNDVSINGKKFGGGMPLGDKSFENLQHPNVVSLNLTTFNYFVFKNFPNLQYLALDSSETFFGMLRDRDGSNLKHLDLTVPEQATLFNYDGTLGVIRGTKFPSLERLCIKFRKDRHNSGCKFLPELLKNHCEHLKILEVTCSPWMLPFDQFPFDCQLDQLTEMRLWGNVVENLGFLMWTPKLKILHVDPFTLEVDDYGEYPANFSTSYGFRLVRGMWGKPLEGVVLNDLEYLQLHCDPDPEYGEVFSLQDLKTLGVMMPNLKTLRVILKKGSIAIICDQWPLLEHLVGMHGSYLTDKDIIGKVGGKGLPDLGQLKTFHLNVACSEGELTDVAAHSGFMRMSKLTDLKVYVGERLSVNAEELLKKSFQKVAIIRNYFENDEHERDRDWECCRISGFMQFMHEILPYDRLWGINNSYSSSEDDLDSNDDIGFNEDGLGLEEDYMDRWSEEEDYTDGWNEVEEVMSQDSEEKEDDVDEDNEYDGENEEDEGDVMS